MRPAKPPGRPAVFTAVEENKFVAHLIAMSFYGFPLTTFDLRCIVKAYLDRAGRNVAIFKKNLPGRDWAESFLRRHKTILSQRTSRNVSYGRAANDEEVINMFFSNVEKELDGVPHENIWNFDETNLVDDPGNKKVITRRGAKYPEHIQNASKACTSLMICGNAVGRLAPLYVNYKAEKMWSTWTENGPESARCNRTKSGWFDHEVFEDWFTTLMLPILKQQVGTKVLIGDNLSSHISVEVLRRCEENSIKFIALPSNSTHILQPLVVAFFRPLKSHWRKVLSDWKKTFSGSRCCTIPKDEFPGLLKKLMIALESGTVQNLRSGFRKTGIVPLNKQEILNRLPSAIMEDSLHSSISSHIGNAFMEELHKQRTEVTKPRGKKRRKMVDVPPGKSIRASDIGNSRTQETAHPSRTVLVRSATFSSKKQEYSHKRYADREQEDDESECSGTFSLHDSEESLNFNNEDSDQSDATRSPGFMDTSTTFATKEYSCKDGEFVAVIFQGQLYPGKVTGVQCDGYMVSVMEKTKKNWRWPVKKGEILYSKEEVLFTIDPPKLVNKRGFYNVRELNDCILQYESV